MKSEKLLTDAVQFVVRNIKAYFKSLMTL